ncbi:MAG: DUF4446 family protein [Lachnospiraceae bacterium]|nr:DUF4446 family protein [Lachnospiraceae bacterium]
MESINTFLSGTTVTLVLCAAVIILLLLVIILFLKTSRQGDEIRTLNSRLTRFMRGSDAQSLENDIVQMYSDHLKIENDIQRDREDIFALQEDQQKAIQRVGIVKYDAFSQMGGNLSFALALLDNNNNGVVLNTVQSTDGCYSYSKIITNGKPDVELGKEERQALRKAMNLYSEGEVEDA